LQNASVTKFALGLGQNFQSWKVETNVYIVYVLINVLCGTYLIFRGAESLCWDLVKFSKVESKEEVAYVLVNVLCGTYLIFSGNEFADVRLS
jgi:hypothetical protein